MKLHLAIKGENRRFSTIFRNKLNRLLKLVNIFYIEMNLPDKLSKSIHGTYPERKQLAALMQVEETARQITNNLLEKISNPDGPILINNRNALLAQNKYHEFLLQIRAKEKVIPRNYLESFTLIKNLVFDGPTGNINLDSVDESLRFVSKTLFGLSNIFFHPYVIWLRILNKDSIK